MASALCLLFGLSLSSLFMKKELLPSISGYFPTSLAFLPISWMMKSRSSLASLHRDLQRNKVSVCGPLGRPPDSVLSNISQKWSRSVQCTAPGCTAALIHRWSAQMGSGRQWHPAALAKDSAGKGDTALRRNYIDCIFVDDQLSLFDRLDAWAISN